MSTSSWRSGRSSSFDRRLGQSRDRLAAPHLVRLGAYRPGALWPVFTASPRGISSARAIFRMGGRQLWPQGRRVTFPTCWFRRCVHPCRAYATTRADVSGCGCWPARIGGCPFRTWIAVNSNPRHGICGRSARDHCGRRRSDRRRHYPLCGAAFCADIWLGPLLFQPAAICRSSRRCRAIRSPGIDKYMALHERQLGKDGSAHRRDPSRFQGAAECSLRDRRQKQFRFSIRFILFREGLAVNHAAASGSFSPSI